MGAKADELRALIDELHTLDERRGYLRARLDRLLDETAEPARPTLVAARPARVRRPRPLNGRAVASSTPGLRLFIEQTAARKGLDLASAARGDLRDDIVAKYPDVPLDVLMSRVSNTLKLLRTAVTRD